LAQNGGTDGTKPNVNGWGTRYDGWMNVLSGLGAPGLDRTVSTGYAGYRPSGWRRFYSSTALQLDTTDLYMSKGVATKIVDRPADDAFARGLEIEGDEDALMMDEYDRLGVISHMQDAVRWSRLYGASAILVIARDGGSLRSPLNLDNLDQVEELRIVDVNQIRPTEKKYSDPLNPQFAKPEYYNLTYRGGEQFEVHDSRLIPVGGDPMPNTHVNLGNVWWQGRPVLAGTVGDLARIEQGLEWALRLLERKQQGIYGMEGLGEMFAQGDDDIVSKRINLVDLVRGNLNSVVVDKEDSYTIENLSLDGIQSLIQEFQVALSASTDIPIVILFGKSSTGLNATGAGDLENYYSMLGRIQSRIALPALERLTSILYVQKSLATAPPDKWKIKFNPLWIPSEVEQATAEASKAQAQATEINALIALVNSSIFAPEEVRQIVIDKYPDYQFAAAPPDPPSLDQQYAAQVAAGQGGPQADLGGKTENTPSTNRKVPDTGSA
jgi:phage-related protein (TIGR01555 family)